MNTKNNGEISLNIAISKNSKLNQEALRKLILVSSLQNFGTMKTNLLNFTIQKITENISNKSDYDLFMISSYEKYMNILISAIILINEYKINII